MKKLFIAIAAVAMAITAQQTAAQGTGAEGIRYWWAKTAPAKGRQTQTALRTPLFLVRQAEDVVRGDMIELRELDQRPHRDLPHPRLVPAVDFRMHDKISGKPFLSVVMVFPEFI